MGTDFPFDMGEADPVGHVCGASLYGAAVAAICGGNARRLLGLSVASGDDVAPSAGANPA